jgi:hypothetical protein
MNDENLLEKHFTAKWHKCDANIPKAQKPGIFKTPGFSMNANDLEVQSKLFLFLLVVVEYLL